MSQPQSAPVRPAPAHRVALVATTGAAVALATLLPATAPAAAPPTAVTAAAPVAPAPLAPAFLAPVTAVIPAVFRPADRAAATAPAVETVPPVGETVPPIGETVTAAVTPVAVSTAAPAATNSTALGKALSKVGAPYRWGASGPNAFDCSGLVNWAYRGVGVSLPRTSRAMSQVGAPVAKADLRPGDLVFFYRPVSHVGIYIGNGKMVHASSRRSPVKISDISYMAFNSARRV